MPGSYSANIGLRTENELLELICSDLTQPGYAFGQKIGASEQLGIKRLEVSSRTTRVLWLLTENWNHYLTWIEQKEPGGTGPK
jgi:hypothetical protein